MSDDHLTPEEIEIIEQVQRTPKPQLEPAMRDVIRHRMISEFRALPHTPAQPTSHARPQIPLRLTAALVAATVVIVTSIVLLQRDDSPSDIIAGRTSTDSPTNLSTAEPSDTASIDMSSQIPDESVSPSPSETTESPTLLTPPPITPSSQTPYATTGALVVIEGPISSISDNIITVYAFTIEVEAQHPILNLVNVGDNVRVEGTFAENGMVMATVVGNIPAAPLSDGAATVSLEGPVTMIDANLVIVNGIPVLLDRADPILQTLQIGDFLSVQGNFEVSGDTIVLIVVNITIIDNIDSIDSECWYHDDGMGMGHWHCDGMGMGMGDAMGMGAP